MGFVCNPLSVITGEICPNYKICKKPCVLARERGKHLPRCVEVPQTNGGGRSVLVIGSGPAGLGAAWVMAKRGFNVTVYERCGETGGALRLIPAARLNKKHLHDTVEKLTSAGVKIKCNTAVDFADFNKLRKQFAVIIIASGTWKPKKLGIDGEDLKNVTPALEYLQNPVKAENVVVIGGGNVAVDAAITACGFDDACVTVCYRKDEKDMKAEPAEIERAKKSGVNFEFNRVPVRIEQNKLREGVCFIQNGKEIFMPCERVIVAVGQSCEHEKDIEDLENVYIAGDAAIGSSSVVSAVTHAKEIAYKIK